VLLLAGHETTASMIALSALAFLRNPEQLAELRGSTDPKLFVNTVEEMLRYLTIVQNGLRRVAVEDIRIGDKENSHEGTHRPTQMRWLRPMCAGRAGRVRPA